VTEIALVTTGAHKRLQPSSPFHACSQSVLHAPLIDRRPHGGAELPDVRVIRDLDDDSYFLLHLSEASPSRRLQFINDQPAQQTYGYCLVHTGSLTKLRAIDSQTLVSRPSGEIGTSYNIMPRIAEPLNERRKGESVRHSRVANFLCSAENGFLTCNNQGSQRFRRLRPKTASTASPTRRNSASSTPSPRRTR
jgi:hypothetical protein